MAEPSTPVLILQNLKRATLDFLDRFKPPADIKAACRTLLKDLGFTDPGNIVSDALADLASNWDALRNQLSGIQLEGAEAIDTLTSRGRDISTTVGKLLDIPDAALSRFGASANAIKTHFR
jgi:hypothetical protein